MYLGLKTKIQHQSFEPRFDAPGSVHSREGEGWLRVVPEEAYHARRGTTATDWTRSSEQEARERWDTQNLGHLVAPPPTPLKLIIHGHVNNDRRRSGHSKSLVWNR
ncbi:hypothetical protein CDAR_22211 [Caerostris darwini]|uniref:Uncharacterized protein n=1 Tax=Caerostris darwini TaxID=1538125 RepID=A0AAV4UTR2_9ARAC|nr:hypothetical protein CDAR_22211 [Caerostris darwini]